MNLFDYAAAQQARDDGIETAINHSAGYHERALRELPLLRSVIGESFQGEDIRAALVKRLGEPPSHKVWGAITRSAIASRIIEGTGVYKPTRSPRTHAHPTQVYRWAP